MSQRKSVKPRKHLTFADQERLKNLIRVRKRSVDNICKEFDIGRSTFFRYKKQFKGGYKPSVILPARNDNHQESLLENGALINKMNVDKRTTVLESGSNLMSSKRKRYQKSYYHEIEDVVLERFNVYRSMGIPVSGPLLRLAAEKQARIILSNPNTSVPVREKYQNAIFGKSWLQSFKERNNVRGKIRINGERASLPANIDVLMEDLLEKIKISNIPISSIYNWDETGLFYRCMPQYTLGARSDDGAGGKTDKKRITAMLSVNGDGSDTSVVIIGTAKKPHGTGPEFWKQHGVRYFSNKTAWMTGDIFETLLKEFDDRMTSPTILLLDNFSGHEVNNAVDYKNIMPLFLPANTTSKTQPLDAGIISTCKVKYRKKLMNFVLEQIDKNCFCMNELSIQVVYLGLSRVQRKLNLALLKMLL